MPNWVFNRLVVYADEATLDAVSLAVEQVAPPDEVGDGGSGEADQVEESVFSFGRLLPRPGGVDWYMWNVEHWGTKWDAQDAQRCRAPGELTFEFDTAWSAPLPVVEHLAQRFPQATVRLDYREEQGWGGSLELAGGELVGSEAYDVPVSHAEVVGRGEECGCDELFQPFEDCWVELAAASGVRDAQVLETVRALSPSWEGTLSQLVGAAGRV